MTEDEMAGCRFSRMWDSSLILQGLTSHQRTSPEEHMFSAEFGGSV